MSVTSVSLFPSKIEYSVLCKYQGTNKFKTYILAPKFISSEPVKLLSHVQPFVISWTVACQALPSMVFSRQEYWNGLPFPFPGDLPDPGIDPGLLHCRQMLYCLSYQGSSNSSQTMLSSEEITKI